MAPPLKILFVCGRHNRRSPTAEKIYKEDRRFSVRSAGMADTCKRIISVGDVKWADLILVMERKYVVRVETAFRKLERLPPITILHVPDEYIFMQRELVAKLKTAVEKAVEDYRLELEAPVDDDA